MFNYSLIIPIMSAIFNTNYLTMSDTDMYGDNIVPMVHVMCN